MKMDVTTLDAKKAGSIDLPDAVFGIEEVRADILQRMVRYQLSKRQAGTHESKTRSQVARSHSKIYKQKGTGNARHGAANAPIFRGGGVAHGPHMRSHAHDLPKKVRALAMRHALSAKVKAGALVILDDAALAAPRTAELKKRLGALGITNALVIGGETVDRNFALAARNIGDLDVLPSAGLNVYDILRRQKLVLTKAAVAEIVKRFVTETEAEAA